MGGDVAGHLQLDDATGILSLNHGLHGGRPSYDSAAWIRSTGTICVFLAA